jgi:hypothetical protein
MFIVTFANGDQMIEGTAVDAYNLDGTPVIDESGNQIKRECKWDDVRNEDLIHYVTIHNGGELAFTISGYEKYTVFYQSDICTKCVVDGFGNLISMHEQYKQISKQVLVATRSYEPELKAVERVVRKVAKEIAGNPHYKKKKKDAKLKKLNDYYSTLAQNVRNKEMIRVEMSINKFMHPIAENNIRPEAFHAGQALQLSMPDEMIKAQIMEGIK